MIELPDACVILALRLGCHWRLLLVPGTYLTEYGVLTGLLAEQTNDNSYRSAGGISQGKALTSQDQC